MIRQSRYFPTHSSRQPPQLACLACRYERRLTVHDRYINACKATVEHLESELAALGPYNTPEAEP